MYVSELELGVLVHAEGVGLPFFCAVKESEEKLTRSLGVNFDFHKIVSVLSMIVVEIGKTV